MQNQFDETDRAIANAVAMATSGVTNPEQWLIDAINGGGSTSGAVVNTETVLGIPTVFSAVRRIAGHLGTLPLEVRRRLPNDASEFAQGHPVYKLLNRKPNDIQSPLVFREVLSLHALLRGNGRAWIERNTQNRPVSLIPIPLENSSTCMIDGAKWHVCYVPTDYVDAQTRRVMGIPASDLANPQRNGTLYKIPDRDVLHIMGLSYNGIWGLDLVDIAKDTFGLDISGRDTASYSFRNNGRPSLLLEAPANQLRTAKEAKEFLDAFNEAHNGVDNAGKTGLIRDGMKAHVLPLSAADAQHIENRRFSQEDIALLFGIEQLLGSSAVYKNLTERQAAYVQNTLQRWFEMWEQEGNRKLLSETERNADSHFLRYNPTEILRGDLGAMASYTASLRQQGAISGNDVRRFHQLPPVPGLDDYTNPNVATDDGIPDNDNEPSGPTEEPDDDTNEMAAQLFNARRRNLVGLLVRENRMLQNASNTEDVNTFDEKIRGVYDRFEPLLSETLTALGMPDTSHQYVERSLGMLGQGLATGTGGIKTTIKNLVHDWPESRAGEFFDV